MSLPRTKNVPLMFDLRRYSVTQAVLSGAALAALSKVSRNSRSCIPSPERS
ncbi:hypothetical protein D3C78_1631890 [compost metagenome]